MSKSNNSTSRVQNCRKFYFFFVICELVFCQEAWRNMVYNFICISVVFCDKLITINAISEKNTLSFSRSFLLQMSFDLDLGVAKNFSRNHTQKKYKFRKKWPDFLVPKKLLTSLCQSYEHGWWLVFLKYRHTK